MDVLAGPFLAVSGLAALGGALKVARPDDTTRAIRLMGLPVTRTLVRVLGAGEGVVATVAAASGARLAVAAVAASYLLFATFVAVAVARRLPISSCGCLGQLDTPPSVAHVVIDLLAAAIATAVALRPTGSLASVLARQPAHGIPLLLLAGVAGYLASLVMGPLAVLRSGRSLEVGE